MWEEIVDIAFVVLKPPSQNRISAVAKQLEMLPQMQTEGCLVARSVVLMLRTL